MPVPITHGIYYNIPSTIQAIESEYFTPPNPTYASHGIRLGKNIRGSVYGGPRPLMNHGHHRYFYQVIALSKTLEGLKPEMATYAEISAKIAEEDILGWGEWVGHCERKSM